MDGAHALRIARSIVRNLLARERLDEAAIPPPGAPPRPSLAELLFLPERLDVAPEGQPRRRQISLVRALFAPERLDEASPSALEAAPRPRRRSLARALFAPEPLPLEPPATPRRRRRWLSWLVVPESLDPPP